VGCSATRRMFDAQGGLVDSGVARRATMLVRLITDSSLLASTAEDPDDLAQLPLLPRAFLDGHLRATGIDDWLRVEGAAVE